MNTGKDNGMNLVTNPKTLFLTDPAKIRAWLKLYCDIRGNIEIEEDGSVTTTGSVLFNQNALTTMTRFRVKFNHVAGDFLCDNCTHLKSLIGAPKTIQGSFMCDACPKLQSLKGAPETVPYLFSCKRCTALTSLRGAPSSCSEFDCSYCAKLLNLQGAPAITHGSFTCTDCSALQSLEGAPREVHGSFRCDGCALLNFEGAPAFVHHNFIANANANLTSLKGSPSRMGGYLDIKECGQLKDLLGLPSDFNTSINCHDCASLTSFKVSAAVTDICCYTAPPIDEETFRSLLQYRTKVLTMEPERHPEIAVLNQYYATNNYLDLITQFRELYGEDFEAGVAPANPLDSPMLEL